MQGQRITIVEGVNDFKPFDIRGSLTVVCCDVFNTLAKYAGLSVYKDHDIFVLVLFIILFLVLISLRFRRIFASTTSTS